MRSRDDDFFVRLPPRCNCLGHFPRISIHFHRSRVIFFFFSVVVLFLRGAFPLFNIILYAWAIFCGVFDFSVASPSEFFLLLRLKPRRACCFESGSQGCQLFSVLGASFYFMTPGLRSAFDLPIELHIAPRRRLLFASSALSFIFLARRLQTSVRPILVQKNDLTLFAYRVDAVLPFSAHQAPFTVPFGVLAERPQSSPCGVP